MKKILFLTGLAGLIIFSAVLFTQCSKDGDSLTGTVMLDDETIASGAVVVVSKSADAADIVATVIADENGIYSVSSLESGTYYVSARWEPSNSNNKEKSANSVILSGTETEISVNGETDANVIIASNAPAGTAIIDLEDGWTWDNSHSTIKFQFPYDLANAVFEGHFATAGFDVLHFDEANPENTEAKAWVDLISVETGSPADPCGHTRDGIEGCIAGTFGVELDPADTVDTYCSDGTMVSSYPNQTKEAFDLWGDGSPTTYMKQSAVVGNTGVATFVFTDVVAYGTGYKALADFTFNGVTHSVDFYFNYLEGYEGENRSGDAVSYISFFGWFDFAALTLFGIESGHVSTADITVKISAQFNKVL